MYICKVFALAGLTAIPTPTFLRRHQTSALESAARAHTFIKRRALLLFQGRVLAHFVCRRAMSIISRFFERTHPHCVPNAIELLIRHRSEQLRTRVYEFNGSHSRWIYVDVIVTWWFCIILRCRGHRPQWSIWMQNTQLLLDDWVIFD